LEDINREVSAWLGTPQGKQDVVDIKNAFVDMAKALKDVVGFLKQVKGFLDVIKPLTDLIGGIQNGYLNNLFGGLRLLTPGATPSGGNQSAPGGRGTRGITVNINAPIDSVSAGREIKRVLDDYARANGSR
jgi:hypothetical protein